MTEARRVDDPPAYRHDSPMTATHRRTPRPHDFMPGVAKPTRCVFPFRVEVSAEDFHALLKNARRQSPEARRLIAAADPTHATGLVVVTGSSAEGLALRALDVAVAPKAVPAIDRALKAAQDGHGHVALGSTARDAR